MNKVFVTLVFAIFCGHADGGGSTAYGKIAEMYTSWDWTMVSVPDIANSTNANPNPDDCPNKTYFAIEPEDKNYQIMHSVLMTAQYGEKQVRFYVSGCGGQNDQYPRIISIWSK